LSLGGKFDLLPGRRVKFGFSWLRAVKFEAKFTSRQTKFELNHPKFNSNSPDILSPFIYLLCKFEFESDLL